MSEITNLNSLLEATYSSYIANNETIKYSDCILNILKKEHIWPVLKVKKFKNNDNLVLIHNTYNNKNIKDFEQLYNECRSVILDFSREIGNNIVITFANSIPERIDSNSYISEDNDIYNIALDGTMITVYNHNGIWHFGTTSCPDINKSKFNHPTKSHGYMLDETLYNMFQSRVDINDPDISNKLRGLLTSYLNPLYSYEFVLVHNDNKHIINYTKELGENYKFLFHINTKNRLTFENINFNEVNLLEINIKYLHTFSNYIEAIDYLNTTENCYGILARKNNKLYKITQKEILHREEFDPCNPNIWCNFIYVYMLNNPEYTINNYIDNYGKNYVTIYDDNGVVIDPTYLIHTCFNIIKDIFYGFYITTTKYYPKYNRFKTNMDIDKTLNPLIRYHLAQLRYNQIKLYKKHIITPNNVFYYLCNNNNIKNIKKIISHLASVNIYDIPLNKLNLLNKLNFELNK
jgi:hypothetical protein